jgi:sugar O-acyltransferase (sialic acid O-acetyltransferase NeuD family)
MKSYSVSDGFGRDEVAAAARILVVGAGGFGREVVEWIAQSWPEQQERVIGFLAEGSGVVPTALGSLPILGDPSDFVPREHDRFVLAIGIPGVRRSVAESLASRDARFLTLVHPQAVVARTARFGQGSVVCPFAVLSDSAQLGRHVLVNYYAALGHDAHVGDFSVMSPYATMGGHACADDDVFLGMHAVVGPRTRVGSRSKVSAGSCALHDVPPDSLVFGVPGRTVRLVAPGTERGEV